MNLLIACYIMSVGLQISIGGGIVMSAKPGTKEARNAVALILSAPLAPIVLPITAAKTLINAWKPNERTETK